MTNHRSYEAAVVRAARELGDLQLEVLETVADALGADSELGWIEATQISRSQIAGLGLRKAVATATDLVKLIDARSEERLPGRHGSDR